MNNNQVNIKDIFKNIISSKKYLYLFIGSSIIVGILYSLSLDNIYKSTVTMLPQAQENSKISGLAELAGVNLGIDNINNETFYQDVIVSNKILDKLIKKRWFYPKDEKGLLLQEILDINYDNNTENYEAKLEYEVKKYLREESISFKVSKDNGIMTLIVRFPKEPKISADIANWLANELHIFNEEYRKNKTNENLISVKKQLDDSKLELEKVENKLKQFQVENKSFSQSPELKLSFERIEREVITENTIYTELRRQYELAKIENEKSRQTIIFLDKAFVPVEKDSPSRLLIITVFAFAGLFLSIIYILTKNKQFL